MSKRRVGNKIGQASTAIDGGYNSGKFGNIGREALNFTTPAGTARGRLWLWVQSRSTNEALWVLDISIRTREYVPPVIGLYSADDVTANQYGTRLEFWITDNDRVAQLTNDNFHAVGPDGSERSINHTPWPPVTGRPRDTEVFTVIVNSRRQTMVGISSITTRGASPILRAMQRTVRGLVRRRRQSRSLMSTLAIRS